MQRILILSTGVICGAFLFIIALVNILPWQVTSPLIALSVGISTVIWNYLHEKDERQKKDNLPQRPIRTEKILPEQKPSPETTLSDILVTIEKAARAYKAVQEATHKTDETIISEGFKIDPEDFQYYELDLEEGEVLSCSLKSTDTVSLYILDRRNLSKLEHDKDFGYEEGIENVYRGAFEFDVPKSGKWFLVVENETQAEVKVNVEVKVK